MSDSNVDVPDDVQRKKGSRRSSKKDVRSGVIHIESVEQYEKLKNNGFVIVDINTSWCGPCRKFAPVFEEMAINNPGVVFLSVDAEEIEHEDCDIKSVPTFKIFLNGEQRREFSGVDKERLERYIERYQVQIYFNGKIQRLFSEEDREKILNYISKFPNE